MEYLENPAKPGVALQTPTLTKTYSNLKGWFANGWILPSCEVPCSFMIWYLSYRMGCAIYISNVNFSAVYCSVENVQLVLKFSWKLTGPRLNSSKEKNVLNSHLLLIHNHQNFMTNEIIRNNKSYITFDAMDTILKSM